MCCICSFVRMILPAPGCRFRVFNRCLCKIFGQARGAVSRRCHWCLLRGHCWASIPVTKDVLEQPLLLREGMALLDAVGTSLTGVRMLFCGHCWSSVPVTNDVLEQPLLLREGMVLCDGVETSPTFIRNVLSAVSSGWPLLRIGAAQRIQTQAPPL